MVLEIGQIAIDIPVWISMLFCLSLAFTVTYVVIPSINTVSKAKHLFDKPEARKSHTSEIPTLGGVAVFLGMVLPLAFLGGPTFEHQLKFILIGLLILFFVGIKDDLLVISPRTKLIAEIIAISIVAILGDIRVTSFHGLMGIDLLPYYLSILFTIFVFIVIINGFNLIDGIDGLSAGVGILSAVSLGFWFLLIRDHSFAGFCFAVAGALLAFFRFNVFGKTNKIFLGDTGSLVLGLSISILIVRFLESSLTGTIVSREDFPAPTLAIAILIIPLMDTLRVFTLRLLVGKSPFKPDRFHTHHKFLLLGFSHLKTTLIILGFNLGIIIFSVLLSDLGNIKMLYVIIPATLALTSIPGLFFRYRVRKFLIRLNLLGNLTWILPVTLTNLLVSNFNWIKYEKSSHLPTPGQKGQRDNNEDLDRLLKDAYLKTESQDGVEQNHANDGENYNSEKEKRDSDDENPKDIELKTYKGIELTK
jgi:UDP-GlcNAc:undecaprenyl-phosphate/decaprenyl-phosphate GlcNAc-1-phosphate transferase